MPSDSPYHQRSTGGSPHAVQWLDLVPSPSSGPSTANQPGRPVAAPLGNLARLDTRTDSAAANPSAAWRLTTPQSLLAASPCALPACACSQVHTRTRPSIRNTYALTSAPWMDPAGRVAVAARTTPHPFQTARATEVAKRRLSATVAATRQAVDLTLIEELAVAGKPIDPLASISRSSPTGLSILLSAMTRAV